MDDKAVVKIVREAIREELSVFKQDVATKEDLKKFATKADLMEYESRISKSLLSVRESVLHVLQRFEQEMATISMKLKFYDFDYLVSQNDALAKVLK